MCTVRWLQSHSHNFYATSEALEYFLLPWVNYAIINMKLKPLNVTTKWFCKNGKKHIFDAIAEYTCLTFSQDLICYSLLVNVCKCMWMSGWRSAWLFMYDLDSVLVFSANFSTFDMLAFLWQLQIWDWFLCLFANGSHWPLLCFWKKNFEKH